MPKPPKILDEPIVIFGAEERDSRVAASPRLIAALCAYSQARLTLGSGVDQLTAAGFAIPILRDLYTPGFIPPNFRDALHPDDAPAIAHLNLANALAIPAFDSTGGLIDLCFWRLNTSIPTWIGNLAATPAGTFAPRLAKILGEVTLVDSVDLLASRMTSGDKQVFLLRPDIDLVHQLRTFAAGAPDRIVRIDASDSVRMACHAVGLRIADEQDALPWQFISHSRDHHRAVFRAGAITVVADTPWHETGAAAVEVRLDDGRSYLDRIDLAQSDQLSGYVEIASETLGIQTKALSGLFAAGFLARLARIEATGEEVESAPVIRLVPSAPEAIFAVRNPLEEWQRDVEQLGWIGGKQAKNLCLLALAGLSSERPPWLMLRGAPEQTLPITGLLGAIIAIDRCVPLARTTESSLVHVGLDGLHHKAILIDDASDLRPATITNLRVLAARGKIALPRLVRSRSNGRMESEIRELAGPAGLIGASVQASALDDLALVVPLDDSSEESAAVAAFERRQVMGVEPVLTEERRDALLSAWRRRLDAIPRLPVFIPGADRLDFAIRCDRHRIEQRWLLGLAAASALLHHEQRAQLDGHLVARDEDIELAIASTHGLIGIEHHDLTPVARWVIGAIAARTDRTMTMPQMEAGKPQWTRSQFRLALDELVGLGLIEHPVGGRGRRAHPYFLVDGIGTGGSGIRLMPENKCCAMQHAIISPFATGAYNEMA